MIFGAILGINKVDALTCTGQGANGATFVDYSINGTVGENIGGFIWYRSNSENGYITVVCQTNVVPPAEDEVYQNLVVSGTSFKIKSVAAFSGFGYFSDVLAYPTDVFGELVGNYNIGFGNGNSSFVNQEYTGFSYGFSRVSSDQKVAFRVFVNNTNGERKTISFYSYTNSYEFIVGGAANSFESMLAAWQQSQTNYNTDRVVDTIDQDHTYNNNASENIDGKQDIDDLSDAEQGLLDSLDFSGAEDIDITINAETSSFIWEIVNQLRQMNGAIVLLMTSILGLGIIKMILNR